MKLIIDVDEKTFLACKRWLDEGVAQWAEDIIANGIPYEERSQGECRTCKYYHPFSNEPRGDGYCVLARITPEGMTTINCNDEFGCSDYQKGGAE